MCFLSQCRSTINCCRRLRRSRQRQQSRQYISPSSDPELRGYRPGAEGDSPAAPGERASLTVRPDKAAAPRANPFGNAKPVDITAKLAELDARDAQRKVRRRLPLSI